MLQEMADLVVDPWIDHHPIRIYDDEKLAERARDEEATILVVEADLCGPAVFELPLIALCSCRGEPNNVDVAAATAAGVPVIRAPGRNADAVAELTVGLLIAATRFIVAADRDVRAGEMMRGGEIPYQRFRGWQVAGRTAGLVGLGAVGRATRWRLEGLGMRVIAYDPYANDATHSMEDLLAEADVVSMHAPITEETARMIGKPQFEAMRDGAVYLNTARAQLHDTDALVAALESGKLSAAGLDHFEGEFIKPEHPLCAMDNVVLTPHIGGASYDTEANHTRLVAEDLHRLLVTGERPVNIVNPEVLDQAPPR
jgi:D-3-phosphoglycerate dehydrogenase